MAITAKRGNGGTAGSADVTFLMKLGEAIEDLQISQAPVDSMRRALVGESIDDGAMSQINSWDQSLRQVLDNLISNDPANLGAGGQKLGSVLVREEAAVTAAQMVSVVGTQLGMKTRVEDQASENVFAISAESVPQYMGKRSTALNKFVKVGEAFDNRETRAAVLYTMAFNYNASRQNEFGETIWPTLSLPADQIGFGIVVNRLTVHRGWTHNVSGDPIQNSKIDLMRAAANHEILQKKKTEVVPIVRADSAKYFVSSAVMPVQTVNHEGMALQTSALKPGVEINLLGISQTDAGLAEGNRRVVDTIDPAISVKSLLVKLGDDVFEFDIYGYPGSNYTYNPQGMDKARILSFDSQVLNINPKSVRWDGSAVSESALTDAQAAGYIVKMRVKVSGDANPEFGTVSLDKNRIGLSEIRDANGELVAGTDAVAQDLATLFASADVIGYRVQAWLTNMAMRDNGDIIDCTYFTQLYEVPLLSPVTALRPVSSSGQTDASDYEALVKTVRYRLRNDAVTSIFESCARLNDMAINAYKVEDLPSIYGAARFHVLPRYIQKTGADKIAVSDLVGSLDTKDIMANLNAALTNYVRDVAITLYIDSEYEPAQDSLGIVAKPTLIIATDPRLHRYLLIDGDIRTGTEVFDVKIVSTIDRRFKNKIFMSFGVFDEQRNSTPNILNWGNLVWGSEVVHSAQFPRSGGMSIETIMQPRYRFINHLPVAALLEFDGVPDLFTAKPTLRVDNINTINVTVPDAGGTP